jgi:hypothetical protein
MSTGKDGKDWGGGDGGIPYVDSSIKLAVARRYIPSFGLAGPLAIEL